MPQLSDTRHAVEVFCATSRRDTLADCGETFTPQATVRVTAAVALDNAIPAGSNLRLHGHVAFADGGVCGTRNDFAGIRSAGQRAAASTRRARR